MEKKVVAILTLAVLLSGCDEQRQYNGMVVTDTSTGKQYMLEHNLGDNYFIRERLRVVAGKDTTYMFK